MKIVNMTPHAIVVGERTYEPSGMVARIEQESKVIGTIDGFEIEVNTVVGHNLPEFTEGTYLLVSAMVLTIAKELGRFDCIAPNTNKAVRNDKGHIVSVPGFVA